MAALDPDNYIKLFKLNDSQDFPNLPPESVAIIPARKSIFHTMFNSENKGRPAPSAEEDSAVFTDDGVSLLLKFRIELDELFCHCGDISGIAAVLWEDISRRLFDRGFNFGARQCAVKWDALYSEYAEAAGSDDESRMVESVHFAALEEYFKLRSKYVDSKILEDITEFLNSRFDCPSAAHKTIENTGVKPDYNDESSRGLVREDFSNLSNDEDSHILVNAINAAQKMLDDNLKEESQDRQTEDSTGNLKQSSPVNTAHREDERKEEASGSHPVFMRSENEDFCWDPDSTQCFLDLKLYAESSRETKQRIVRNYGSIVGFVCQKMLLNGYQVFESDCRWKWASLIRGYNQDVKKLREAGGNGTAVRNYFWEMDKVLKKSAKENGAQCSPVFEWDEGSVRKLIGIRIPMENAFAMFKKYVILWQYVASQMAKHDLHPTFNECSIRWMELCESYKLCLETVKRRGNCIEVNWTFYQDMKLGYEQNNKNTEAIIDYRCSAGVDIEAEYQSENSTEASTFTMSSSGGETLADTDLEGLSSVRDFNIGKNSDIDFLETEESLDVSQGQSSESDQTEASDPMDFVIFEGIPALRSSDMENLETQQGRAEAPKRFESPAVGGSNNRTAWNEESTFLLINLKLSRELKFRSPSIVESNLWKEIAADMQSAGYVVSDKACAERWHQVKTAYEKNVCFKNGETIPSKFQEQLKITKMPLTNSIKPETKRTTNGISSARFVWTHDAVVTLIKLRFSSTIKGQKKYGAPIAAVMQGAGYPTIAPGDVSRKWTRIIGTYRKASRRYDRGEKVKWPYFELLDGYMKGLTDSEESQKPQPQSMVFWTPGAANALIDVKLSLDRSFHESDIPPSSSVWEKAAAALRVEGIPVNNYDCAAEWKFLIEAYKRTKKELCNGNGAIIGKYFVMVDEAINKVIGADPNKTEDIQEPIDFSIAGKKRKLDEELGENIAAKRARIEKPKHRVHQKVDENVINLSKKAAESPASYGPAANSSKLNALAENNIPANSGTDSTATSSVVEETEDSPILKSALDSGSQQNTEPLDNSVSTNKGNCITCEMYGVNDHVDSSKENVAFVETEARSKLSSKKEDTQSRILCDQKPCNEPNRSALSPCRKNVLVQDKAVNSTKIIEVEGVNERWSEAATHLLIDLKAQHNRQFPLLPRPEIQWEKVAALLGRLGYNYASTECSKRWDFLKTVYEQNITDLCANRVVQSWPYFDRLDSIYKKLKVSYNKCRWILPKKRTHEEAEEQVTLPKKFIISMSPLGTQVATVFGISNTAGIAIDLKKND